MVEFARLPIDQRLTYFQEVANRRGLTRLIVEKDFWVCFSLDLLFSTPAIADKLVFKGGTSLAKVYGVIKRFSEDIDLSVDPDWLGFGADNAPDGAKSRSQFEKRLERLNSRCVAAADQEIRPALERAIRDRLGPPPGSGPYFTFELDGETRSPVLTFRYPTKEPLRTGFIHPQVRLELGSLTDQRPVGLHDVRPWVAEDLPQMFARPSCSVVALEMERTFWEKATILHAEYHRPADKPIRSRLSRDCYDLCCMAAHPAGRRAMFDFRLLARVVRHKQTYFQSAWANFGTAKPGSLHLVPPASRLAELRAEYQRTQEMFTESPPAFDDMLAQLRSVEVEVNKERALSMSSDGPEVPIKE
jgi:hypothetical protein